MATSSSRKKRNSEQYSDYKKKITSAKRVMMLIFGGSIAVFIVIIAAAIANEGAAAFVSSLLSVNLFYLLIALLVVFASNIMRYPKWERYMKRLGIKISRAKNIMIYLSMSSMEITPGRWGRAIVSYTINKLTRVKFAAMFPAIVADIFTDFSGFAIVCLAAALFIGKYVALSFFVTFLLLLPFIFLYVRGPFDFVRRRFGRIKWLRGFFYNAIIYFKSNRKLRNSDYIYSMVFTIPSMFLNGVALYFVILALGINIPLSTMPQVIFIFSSSLLLGIITGIPAALGVTDGVLIGYLVLFFGGFGLDFGLASIISILFRIVNWWFVEGFGFAALAYTFKYWKLPEHKARAVAGV
ncbi:MAG: flippase-like domain-containing protein [Candidatus Marsarchaeota archaeon]|jgi:uncharacterized protein (TIRG00374 family)|nr:flippase-like domain-containing protein [Candidatus Marsarchaeota archaeon]